MSSTNYRSAYLTKLGNLTAKNVLVKLVDEANADGLGWASFRLISDHTEIKLRTVRRMFQVFEAMHLLKRCTTVNQFGKTVDAFQLAVEMLGTDLRAEFKVAHAAAQRKKQVVSETGEELGLEVVSQTAEVVSETRQAVSETEPPHPHKGVPVSVPVLPHPPERPQGGLCDLKPDQLAHLERVPSGDRAMWERWYRDDNAAKAAEQEAETKREATLRAEYATRESAVETVMRACSFQRGTRKRCEIAEVLGQVFVSEAARGSEPWETGPRLSVAWLRQVAWVAESKAKGERAVDYGAVKFFLEGHWRKYAGSAR